MFYFIVMLLQSPDCWAKQSPGQDVGYSFGCQEGGGYGEHSKPGLKLRKEE